MNYPWLPLNINNKMYDSINKKIDDIGNAMIRHNKIIKETDNIGLLGGNMGLVIFLYSYSNFIKCQKFYDFGSSIVLSALEKLHKSINCNYYFDISYSNGIPGILWTLKYLKTQEFLDINEEEMLLPFSNILKKEMIKQIKLGNLDYFHGSLGIAKYLLSERDYNDQWIWEEFFDYLLKFAIDGKNDEIRWFRYDLFTNRIIKNEYDLGIPHGITGIIGVLLDFYESDIKQGFIKNLITRSITFLLNNKMNKKNRISFFPPKILTNSIGRESRLGWCYGDLGIGLILLRTSLIFNDENLYDQAVYILKVTVKRTNLYTNGVRDACLCHGSAGIAHLFHRIYSYTNINEFNTASLYWYNKTLELAIQNGPASYKVWYGGNGSEWQDNYSFIQGIAGIGLSLLAAISDIEPKWDQSLLIS